MIRDVRILRGARSALGLTQADLAERSGVSRNTIARLEDNLTDPRRSTLFVLQKALENEGVIFLPETEDASEGFRIRNPKN